MKTIEPMKITDGLWKDDAEILSASYFFLVADPLKAIIAEWKKPTIKNSISNALYDAISRGTVSFRQSRFGFQFLGEFNAEISKELKKMGAEWDSVSKSFLVRELPSDSRVALDIAERNNRLFVDKLDYKLGELSVALVAMKPQDIAVMTADDKALNAVDKHMEQGVRRYGKPFEAVAVKFQLDPHQKTMLKNQYTFNAQVGIKGLSEKSVERLRGMIEENTASGRGSAQLVKRFSEEFELSENKAKNIARQETSLLLSKYRELKAKGAGFNKYVWRTSHDPLVRPTMEQQRRGDTSNNHRILDGKVFSFDDPPVTNVTTGRRANPGEDAFCRCVAAIVIEED